MKFDLLTTVEDGGCSAKLPAQKLAEILRDLPKSSHPDLLVGIDTQDDAGVYKISDELALIQTTDFFPPICSDPYEFGQIAAANALSDIYAMGGKPLTALNLIMFPDDKIPLDVYKEILKGGYDKVAESGAVILGGHTINDYPPKYGLAVTGTVHPEKVITNANAKPGEVLILTKPIGTGVVVAGHKLRMIQKDKYRAALDCMKVLNKKASEVMQKYEVRCATDITGFSLLGHAMQLARESNVSLKFESKNIPLLEGAYNLVDTGCIPGAAFRNQAYAEKECRFDSVDYNLRMLMFDAQTSGGILMTVKPENADQIVRELNGSSNLKSGIVGEVKSRQEVRIIVC